jgi:hypothetical protein
VKRAPAGSGQAPVASGMGVEAPAAVGCVGAALVVSGWSRRRPRARARARAGRRDGRSSGVGCAWAAAEEPCDGDGYTAAAEPALHSTLCLGGCGRDRMKRCGHERRLKFSIFDGLLGGRQT